MVHYIYTYFIHNKNIREETQLDEVWKKPKETKLVNFVKPITMSSISNTNCPLQPKSNKPNLIPIVEYPKEGAFFTCSMTSGCINDCINESPPRRVRDIYVFRWYMSRYSDVRAVP